MNTNSREFCGWRRKNLHILFIFTTSLQKSEYSHGNLWCHPGNPWTTTYICEKMHRIREENHRICEKNHRITEVSSYSEQNPRFSSSDLGIVHPDGEWPMTSGEQTNKWRWFIQTRQNDTEGHVEAQKTIRTIKRPWWQRRPWFGYGPRHRGWIQTLCCQTFVVYVGMFLSFSLCLFLSLSLFLALSAFCARPPLLSPPSTLFTIDIDSSP